MPQQSNNLLFQWPTIDRSSFITEMILLFESSGNRVLTLSSNYPYEIWIDGVFLGNGGHRCSNGIAYSETWVECQTSNLIQIRLHWINYENNEVYYRCLFKDPFIVDFDNNAQWICYHDFSIRFGTKICPQLSRQNYVIAQPFKSLEYLTLQTYPSKWKIKKYPVKKCQYVPVNYKKIRSQIIKPRYAGYGNIDKFQPEKSDDIILYIKKLCPVNLIVDTYDLGTIALYRMEVTTKSESCMFTYSEVYSFDDINDSAISYSEFNKVGSTLGRQNVLTADFFQKNLVRASSFGERGCRYLHVFYPSCLYNHNAILEVPPDSEPEFLVWRLEYPYIWKPISIDIDYLPIIEACKANLIACTDGGLVDTCWRERTQWTGDMRMSAMAIRSLSNNKEIIDLVLHQISTSYDKNTGLVSGSWPIKNSDCKLQIPTFHLAFCLAAVENYDTKKNVMNVVMSSIEFWKKTYINNGFLSGMPGWYFVDWDNTNELVVGKNILSSQHHAICHAWWQELCSLLKISSGIDTKKFNKLFWTKKAYKLISEDNTENMHATVAIINTELGMHHFDACIDYILDQIDKPNLKQIITPYYAYFIAKALKKKSPNLAKKFILEYYNPIVLSYGTICERTVEDDSMAHGWSVAIASIICDTDSYL